MTWAEIIADRIRTDDSDFHLTNNMPTVSVGWKNDIITPLYFCCAPYKAMKWGSKPLT